MSHGTSRCLVRFRTTTKLRLPRHQGPRWERQANSTSGCSDGRMSLNAQYLSGPSIRMAGVSRGLVEVNVCRVRLALKRRSAAGCQVRSQDRARYHSIYLENVEATAEKIGRYRIDANISFVLE